MIEAWDAMDGTTPEEQVSSYIDWIREHPEHRESLLPLLPQNSSIYTGRGSNQVTRLRGYILASFEVIGLPEPGLIYVLEELENSQRPYLVAAAAKALRGYAFPSSKLVQFLMTSIINVQHHDDALSFDSYKTTWPLTKHTTALDEVLSTIKWLGAHAKSAIPDLKSMRENSAYSKAMREEIDKIIQSINSSAKETHSTCCSIPSGQHSKVKHNLEKIKSLTDILFEDQANNTITYGEFFQSKPSVTAFFYTRCGNPNKCSLTVTKLAQLQTKLRINNMSDYVRIAAITYDPGYDLPERLKGYCVNRGFTFDDNNRALRVKADRFSEIRDYFELGANYAGSIVSRHHIELYLLNSFGQINTVFANLQWQVQDVADELIQLLANDSNQNVAIQKPH